MQHPTAVRFSDAKVGRDVAKNSRVIILRLTVDQGLQHAYGRANFMEKHSHGGSFSLSFCASILEVARWKNDRH